MKSIAIWFGTALLFGALYSCSEKPDKSANEIDLADNDKGIIRFSEEQLKMAGIQTGHPEKRLVADVVDCSGFIDVPPTNIGTVHSPANGIIREINVVPGRKVMKNEVLVLVSDPEIAQIQEDYLNEKSRLEFQENEYERKRKLYNQNAISKKDFLAAQNGYQTSKNKVESLKEQLFLLGISETDLEKNGIFSTIPVRAPFNGFISDVYVNIGMYIDENKPVIEIINYDHVHLELHVYSNDINKIELDQAVRFRLAGSDKSGWGTIQLIGKKVDDVDRSVLVHAHIDKTGYDLTIGSSVMAEILTRADTAYTVPEEAIIIEGESRFIYVEENGGFSKTGVTTGRKYNGFIELQDINELNNNKLVTKGAYYLAD